MVIKLPFCIVYLGRFFAMTSVMYIKYTPSSHVDIRLRYTRSVGEQIFACDEGVMGFLRPKNCGGICRRMTL